MKKHVIVAAGLAVISSSAFASKARLEALGQDGQKGSFYIQDSRRVFANPARLAAMGRYLTAEHGTDLSTTNDSAGSPNAEGGFFNEAAGFSYGVYLGSDVNIDASGVVTTGAGTRDDYLKPENNLDLFFAGDAGIQWGARLNYAKASDEQAAAHEKTATAFGLGFGIVMGDLAAYTNLVLSDKSEATTAASNSDWEADFGFELGANYTWNDMTFMVEFDSSGEEFGASGAKSTYEETNFMLGVGKVHEVASNARLFTDAAFNYMKAETKAGSAAATEAKAKNLGVTLGYEADATSWLVLRGSVKQDILIGDTENNAGKKVTNVNTTTTAIGATLNFGNLKLDGTLSAGTNGTLTLDNAMARTSVTYMF